MLGSLLAGFAWSMGSLVAFGAVQGIGAGAIATETAKRDYYEVLGVDRGADEGAIKSSYRKLAMQYHPDRNPGDAAAEEKFKEAAEAYSVLSDQQKRASYDRFGHQGVSGAAGNGGFDANGFPDLSDVLNEMFGFGDPFGGARGQQRRNRARRSLHHLPRQGQGRALHAQVVGGPARGRVQRVPLQRG